MSLCKVSLCCGLNTHTGRALGAYLGWARLLGGCVRRSLLEPDGLPLLLCRRVLCAFWASGARW